MKNSWHFNGNIRQFCPPPHSRQAPSSILSCWEPYALTHNSRLKSFSNRTSMLFASGQSDSPNCTSLLLHKLTKKKRTSATLICCAAAQGLIRQGRIHPNKMNSSWLTWRETTSTTLKIYFPYIYIDSCWLILKRLKSVFGNNEPEDSISYVWAQLPLSSVRIARIQNHCRRPVFHSQCIQWRARSVASTCYSALLVEWDLWQEAKQSLIGP